MRASFRLLRRQVRLDSDKPFKRSRSNERNIAEQIISNLKTKLNYKNKTYFLAPIKLDDSIFVNILTNDKEKQGHILRIIDDAKRLGKTNVEPFVIKKTDVSFENGNLVSNRRGDELNQWIEEYNKSEEIRRANDNVRNLHWGVEKYLPTMASFVSQDSPLSHVSKLNIKEHSVLYNTDFNLTAQRPSILFASYENEQEYKFIPMSGLEYITVPTFVSISRRLSNGTLQTFSPIPLIIGYLPENNQTTLSPHIMVPIYEIIESTGRNSVDYRRSAFSQYDNLSEGFPSYWNKEASFINSTEIVDETYKLDINNVSKSVAFINEFDSSYSANIFVASKYNNSPGSYLSPMFVVDNFGNIEAIAKDQIHDERLEYGKMVQSNNSYKFIGSERNRNKFLIANNNKIIIADDLLNPVFKQPLFVTVTEMFSDNLIDIDNIERKNIYDVYLKDKLSAFSTRLNFATKTISRKEKEERQKSTSIYGGQSTMGSEVGVYCTNSNKTNLATLITVYDHNGRLDFAGNIDRVDTQVWASVLMSRGEQLAVNVNLQNGQGVILTLNYHSIIKTFLMKKGSDSTIIIASGNIEDARFEARIENPCL